MCVCLLVFPSVCTVYQSVSGDYVAEQLSRLQKVQTSAVRLVLKKRKLQLSGIRCLPACGISSPSLTLKPSSKLSFFDRHFYKFRRIVVCVREGVCVCAVSYTHLTLPTS